MIGIHVRAKTIKNKVAPPFRECNFEIHFGKGIVEHEQVFDELRKFGSAVIEGREITISGTGSWKTLTAVNVKTGEVEAEKKFYKADFGDVWRDPQYRKYVEALLCECMTRKLENPEDATLDTESYEEVRAASMDLDLAGIEDLDV